MIRKLFVVLLATAALIVAFSSSLSLGETCQERCARLYAGNPAAISACQARCR